MATFTGQLISATYDAILKTIDNDAIGGTAKQLTDGLGNVTPLYVSTTQIGIGITPTEALHVSGNALITGYATISGDLAWGTLTDTGQSISVTKFVDQADGIANNDNDTTIPTSAAVKDLIDSSITAQDLDFSGDGGTTGAVDLDSQSLAVVGTTNEIETSASNQSLTIGLPSNVTIGNDLTITNDITTNGNAQFKGTIDQIKNSTTVTKFTGVTGSGFAASKLEFFKNTDLKIELDGETGNGIFAGKVSSSSTVSGDSSLTLTTKDYVDASVALHDTLQEVLAVGNSTSGSDIAITAGDKITNFTSTGIDDNATSNVLTIGDASSSFTGNVGIGSSPVGNAGTNYLSIGTAGTTAGGIQLWAANNQTHFLQFGDVATGTGYYKGAISYNHSSDTLELLQDAVSALSFTGSQAATFTGSVSATGVIFANRTLEVLGQNLTHGASRIKICQEDTNKSQIRYYGADASTKGSLEFMATTSDGSSSVTPLSIDSSGNVGLGNDTPSYKIDAKQTTSGNGTCDFRLAGRRANSTTSFIVSTIYAENFDNGTGDVTIGKIDFSIDGDASSDQSQYGKMIFSTANNSSEVIALTIDSSQNSTFAGSISSKDISIKQSDDSGFDGGLIIERSANTQKLVIGMDGGAINFNSPDSLTYKFRANGTEKASINSSGNATFAGSITSSGNIGSTIDANTTNQVSVTNSNSGSSATARFLAVSDSGNIQIKAVSSTNTTYGAGDVGVINCDTMSGGLRFAHNDQVKYTLGFDGFNTWTGGGSFGGNVGIGTDSPDANLHIDKDDASPVLLVKASGQTSSTTPFAKLVLAPGSATGADVGSNIMGYRTADFSSAAARSTGLKFGVLQNNTAKDAMWINEAQNVGIGTDSPQVKLHSNVSSATGNFLTQGSVYALEISNSDTTAGNAVGINFGHGGYNFTNFIASVRTGTGANPKGDLVFGGRPSDGATFVERMRIDSSGNIGIGTDSPLAKLDVGKNEVADNQIRITTGVWNEPTLFFNSYSNFNYTIGNFGTSGSKKFQLKSNNGSVILSTGGNDSGNVGIGTSSPDFALDIEAIDSGVQLQLGRTNTSAGSTWMGSDSSGFHLGVGAYGTDNSVADPNGFTVDTSGNVGINLAPSSGIRVLIKGHGTTSGTKSIQANNGSNQDMFYVQDDGSGFLKGSAWTYGSDISLKENITDVENGVDMVLKMKPKHFDYIEGTKNNLGFIAQDIQKIIPEAVSVINEENETLGLKTDFLVPYLVKAIQELKAEVDSLKKQCKCK